jgi:putative ABC transport system permease protein
MLSAISVGLGVTMIIAADFVEGSALAAGGTLEGTTNFGADAMSGMLKFGLNLAGVIILFAAGFLVFNAFAMTITQRRREIGMLRSLGMTRRQVISSVMMEAVIIAGIGVILGLFGGPLVGRIIVAVIHASSGLEFSDYDPAIGSMIVAASLGIVITLLSSYFPARGAAKISPLIALRESSVTGVESLSGRWTFVGFSTIVVMFGYFIIAPPSEWTLPPWDYNLMLVFTLVWLFALGLLLPETVNAVGNGARILSARRRGAMGRIVADNLRRNRQRVTLTVLTLAIGLSTIVSITGILNIMVVSILGAAFETETLSWMVSPIDMQSGVSALNLMNSEHLRMDPEVVDVVHEKTDESADVVDFYMVQIPELGFLFPNMPSFVIDGQIGAEDYNFFAGNAASAREINQNNDCSLLLAPLVAQNNDAWLDDAITVTGPIGPVDCVIAGIGVNALMNATFVFADPELFGLEHVSYVIIDKIPVNIGVQLREELSPIIDNTPGIWLIDGDDGFEQIDQNMDFFRETMNGPLLLAILAAALGVVNTTVMSVSERRREIGLLRAIGATRKQVRYIIIGEAMFIGGIGAVLGILAGGGVIFIMAFVAGGNMWGIRLDPWSAAWTGMQPALYVGTLGLILSPVISALAAWIPSRHILRETPVKSLVRQ